MRVLKGQGGCSKCARAAIQAASAYVLGCDSSRPSADGQLPIFSRPWGCSGIMGIDAQCLREGVRGIHVRKVLE